MKKSRKIYITGEITFEKYEEFSRDLSELESSSNSGYILELASEGGSAYAALAFAARIRSSPCECEVRAYGMVASAAVLILAAGHHRMMSKIGWVMVHEEQGEVQGSVSDIERESKYMRILENQWDKLMHEFTDKMESVAYWEKVHKATTYLSAEHCLEVGLVNELF